MATLLSGVLTYNLVIDPNQVQDQTLFLYLSNLILIPVKQEVTKSHA